VSIIVITSKLFQNIKKKIFHAGSAALTSFEQPLVQSEMAIFFIPMYDSQMEFTYEDN
jgi:hypothetical protein